MISLILLLTAQFCTAPSQPQYRTIPIISDEHGNLFFGDPFEQNEATEVHSPIEQIELTDELQLSADLSHELHVDPSQVLISQPQATTLLTDGDIESLSANSYQPLYTLMRSGEVHQNVADPKADQPEFYSTLAQEPVAADPDTEPIVTDLGALLACGNLGPLSVDDTNTELLSPDTEMEILLNDTSQVSNADRNICCFGPSGSACGQSVGIVRTNSTFNNISGFFENYFVNQIGQKPLKRNICQKQFRAASSYPIHQGKDTDEIPFQCDICPKQLQTSSNYQARRRVHTGEKPFQCNVCKKEFRTSSDYQAHRRVHTGEKPFQCEMCSKEFRTSSDCQKHRRIHNDEKPFKCDFCWKEFSDSSNYHAHRRIHTGEKPFKCDFCQKEFSDPSSYRRHRRIHTDEKPFQCEICSKQFRTSCDYRKHRRIHTGEKPYQCDICSKQFSTSSNCHAHRRVHKLKNHSNATPVKPLHTLNDYQKHRRIHTNETPFKCDFCRKEFNDRNYYVHRRIHIEESSSDVTYSRNCSSPLAIIRDNGEHVLLKNCTHPTGAIKTIAQNVN